MSDLKSKLPDFKEIGSMTGKLFHDIKTSIVGIIGDYKKKREPVASEEPVVKTAAENPAKEPVQEEKVAAKPKAKTTKSKTT